jgi:hypothetical protein
MLSGGAATIFNIVNTLLTVVPLIIISYVLYLLWKKTFKKIASSNIVLVVCFVFMWGIVGWMLNRDFNTTAYETTFNAYKIVSVDENSDIKISDDKGEIQYHYLPVTQSDNKSVSNFKPITKETKFYKIQVINDDTKLQKKDKDGNLIFQYLSVKSFKKNQKPKRPFTTINRTIEAIAVPVMDYTTNKQLKRKDGTLVYSYYSYFNDSITSNKFQIEKRKVNIGEPFVDYKVGDKQLIINKDKELTKFAFIASDEKLEELKSNSIKLGRDNGIIEAQITEVKDNEVEITVSWFSILNSFFIIVFASFFSKWWESKYNPSAASKYALGLIIMGLGFGLLAFGSTGAVDGVKVSMIWLILAYLFHTLGELCLSPVGLSYVSKLVPARMIALMFGMWYLAIAIGNKLAAVVGGQIENITQQYSLSIFFLIFTIVPVAAGLLVLALNPLLKKLMHGVR